MVKSDSILLNIRLYTHYILLHQLVMSSFYLIV